MEEGLAMFWFAEHLPSGPARQDLFLWTLSKCVSPGPGCNVLKMVACSGLSRRHFSLPVLPWILSVKHSCIAKHHGTWAGLRRTGFGYLGFHWLTIYMQKCWNGHSGRTFKVVFSPAIGCSSVKSNLSAWFWAYISLCLSKAYLSFKCWPKST